MKTTNYVILGLLCLVLSGCSTESITNSEVNTLENDQKEMLKTSDDDLGIEQKEAINKSGTKEEFPTDSPAATTQGRGINISTDDKEGTVLTNNKLLIDYGAGATEAIKQAMRQPFYATGQLMFVEQCPFDANKELWHMAYNFTADSDICGNLPCIFVWNSPIIINSENGQMTPPQGSPPGLVIVVTYSPAQTCQ